MDCRAPSPMLFDPISLLVDDAANEEPQELLFDFLDCLIQQQQPPPPVEVPSIVASDGMSSGPASDRQNSPSGSRKRRSTSRFIEADDPEPMHHVGSPVSTMHLSAGYDILPMNTKPFRNSSSSSSHSSSTHGSPHRERAHGHHGQGLSRKNRPQRCSICKECGHKSRTCKFAGAKVGARPASPDGFNINI